MVPPAAKTVWVAGVCLLAAIMASWSAPAHQLDLWAYDFLLRLAPPQASSAAAVVVALQEETLRARGGMPHLRGPLTDVLEVIARARPGVVAVDIQLADAVDPELDRRLDQALASIPRLVLPTNLIEDPRTKSLTWEDPRLEFSRQAALGHVHADPDDDGVSRRVRLSQEAGGRRRWALALKAFQLASGGHPIVESEEALQVGGRQIPASRRSDRALLVRYLPAGVIQRISVEDLLERPAAAEQLRDRAVFIGVTVQGGPDRLMTPYSYGVAMPGVEIHAHLYETLARGEFLRPVSDLTALSMAFLTAAAMAACFQVLSGARVFVAGFLLLLVAHVVPYLFFLRQEVMPVAPLASSTWFCFLALGTRHYLATRQTLRLSEAQRARYQRAVHYVTHEMRTPLTAIQGSSELMGRYALSEEKRREVAGLIHRESRRLGRMIEMFLNVERLSAGELELKKEPVSAREVLEACVERARPLAENKQIRLVLAPGNEEMILADREFLEYACYNLITNAIKYSPAGTEIAVSVDRSGPWSRISVQDQGYGMDADEVKRVFQKFYRTRRAVESGEVGTGIGLALVEEIVMQHGGSIEVESRVNQGSRFTLLLPRPERRSAVGSEHSAVSGRP